MPWEYSFKDSSLKRSGSQKAAGKRGRCQLRNSHWLNKRNSVASATLWPPSEACCRWLNHYQRSSFSPSPCSAFDNVIFLLQLTLPVALTQKPSWQISPLPWASIPWLSWSVNELSVPIHCEQCFSKGGPQPSICIRTATWSVCYTARFLCPSSTPRNHNRNLRGPWKSVVSASSPKTALCPLKFDKHLLPRQESLEQRATCGWWAQSCLRVKNAFYIFKGLSTKKKKNFF